ncbi:hypothetical protein WG66_015962 [Moniliophthora roreri]|nr:hypothetical protein WG66_015962 [Moniliophthora roreri]
MPTEFEMRQRNAKFAKDAKAGKKPTHLSRQEKQAKQSPIGLWALGVVLFIRTGQVDVPVTPKNEVDDRYIAALDFC